MGLLDGKADPGHRRPDRRLAGLRRGPAGPGGGGRGRPLGAGRGLSLTRRTARKLPVEPDVLEIDVTSPEQLAAAATDAGRALGPARRDAPRHRLRPPRLPGRRHVPGRLGRRRGRPPRLGLLAQGAGRGVPPPAGGGRADGGLGRRWSASTSTPRVAWPAYDWMGVAKAALESLSRYLARDLGPDGIRVNLVAAGPGQDHGGQVDPGLHRLRGHLGRRAPLGWDVHDTDVVARACVALFSRLLAHDHRRDPPRRRRRPRRRRLSAGAAIVPRPPTKGAPC